MLAVAPSYNVGQQVFFGLIALLMIVGALRVVTTKNVVHAALWLVVVLAGAAAQYILLAAEFVAVTQVLVYIGAVMVLILFGTMLTRAPIGKTSDLDNQKRFPAFLVAAVMGVLLTYVLVDRFRTEQMPRTVSMLSTDALADAIFGAYSLPFWGLSLLLTAAAIGAIVLARKD
jgi:NADH-quinone oxidoreductase subunit J